MSSMEVIISSTRPAIFLSVSEEEKEEEKIKNKFDRKINKYSVIYEYIKKVKPSTIYIRYPMSDIFFIRITPFINYGY